MTKSGLPINVLDMHVVADGSEICPRCLGAGHVNARGSMTHGPRCETCEGSGRVWVMYEPWRRDVAGEL